MVEDQNFLRPTLPLSDSEENEKGEMTYVVLGIFHDDPTNDPRKWDWGLVDFSGVSDREVQAGTCGHWVDDKTPYGANSAPPRLFNMTRAAMRDTRGRLDRGPEALYFP